MSMDYEIVNGFNNFKQKIDKLKVNSCGKIKLSKIEI